MIKQRALSVIGIIFSSDRESVLLIQRRDVPVWVLPGGGVEPGERSETAISREIFEETGFQIKINRFVGHYLPCNRLTKPTDLFECEIVSGKATPSSESKEVRFFPLSHLPKLIPPPFPEWIADGKRGGPPLLKPLVSVNYTTLFKSLFLHPILVFRFLLSRLKWPINS